MCSGSVFRRHPAVQRGEGVRLHIAKNKPHPQMCDGIDDGRRSLEGFLLSENLDLHFGSVRQRMNGIDVAPAQAEIADA